MKFLSNSLFNTKALGDISRSKEPSKTVGWGVLFVLAASAIGYGFDKLRTRDKKKAAIDVETKKNEKERESYIQKRDKDLEYEREKSNIRYEEYKKKLDLAMKMKESKTVDETEQETICDMPYGKSLKEQLEATPTEVRYLVGGMVESGGFVTIFSREKIGKTTLATQMALCIASGRLYEFLPEEEQVQHAPQKVLIIDLEMKQEELKKRLTGYDIPDNVLREDNIRSIEELCYYIKKNTEDVVEATVFVDNLTKLADSSTNHCEVARNYARLQNLQKELKLNGKIITIIVVVHTVRDYDDYKPITNAMMAGTADVKRFSTSIIALAKAREENQVMIKLTASRNSPDSDKVLVCERAQDPYLHFKYVKTCREAEALPIAPKACKESSMVEDDCCDEMDNPSCQKIYNAFAERGLDEQSIADVLNLDEGGQMVKLNELGVTQEKIGEIYGYSRETVNKKSQDWKRVNGVVKRPKKVS